MSTRDNGLNHSQSKICFATCGADGQSYNGPIITVSGLSNPKRGSRLESRGSKMHVISRRENEGIVIDNRFIVTVLDFDDEHVRLSIESPHEEPYYREEIISLEAEYA
jgi:carbon storage regulator